MRVSDLTGAQLDYWVARADGCVAGAAKEGGRALDGTCEPVVFTTSNGTLRVAKKGSVIDWAPSTDWAQAGPIIEREGIILRPFSDGAWGAAYEFDMDARGGVFYMSGSQEGATPLIAAMRAYVASKFGDEVDDLQVRKGLDK
ncbi:DUF2591 domain-containing protein [Burkholderia cenocepacia]|nr:DUF2591 domain-containing protein [Burkholderia cenocepacia]